MDVFFPKGASTVLFGPSQFERFNPRLANGVTSEKRELLLTLEVSLLMFCSVTVRVLDSGAKSVKVFLYITVI